MRKWIQQRSTKYSLLCPQRLKSNHLLSPLLLSKDMYRRSCCLPGKYPLSYAPLPPVQPNARDQPPPRLLEPPPREESTQTAQPVQQQAQGEPSVPSQQSLPSTHRCPELGPAAPMTQEYVPSRGGNPVPATPTACLQGNMAPGIVAPTSPPVYAGGTQMGSAPRALPSPLHHLSSKQWVMAVPGLHKTSVSQFNTGSTSSRSSKLFQQVLE